MNTEALFTLKRSVIVLSGHQDCLREVFVQHLENIAPGFGERLQNEGLDKILVTSWLESARCAQRWQNIEPLLVRMTREVQDVGLRSRDYDVLIAAWLATLNDCYGSEYDKELSVAWHGLTKKILDYMRVCSTPVEGSAASLAT